jgi:hypothetical protein
MDNVLTTRSDLLVTVFVSSCAKGEEKEKENISFLCKCHTDAAMAI